MPLESKIAQPVSGTSADKSRENRQSVSVLVADDDPIFRSLAVSRMSRLAGEVIEAVSGKDAWDRVRGHRFDLAIVDFEMPDLGGVDLIRCLRGHPDTRHLPIVMCTSHAHAAAIQEAIEAGASSYLVKPLNWPLFERHIRHLLDLSRAAGSERMALRRAEDEAERRRHLVAGFVARLRAKLADLEQGPGAVGTNGEDLRREIDMFALSYGETPPAPSKGSAPLPAAPFATTANNDAGHAAPVPQSPAGVSEGRR